MGPSGGGGISRGGGGGSSPGGGDEGGGGGISSSKVAAALTGFEPFRKEVLFVGGSALGGDLAAGVLDVLALIVLDAGGESAPEGLGVGAL